MKKFFTLLLSILAINCAFADDEITYDNYLIDTVDDEEVIYKIDDPATFESDNHSESTTNLTTFTFTSNGSSVEVTRADVTYVKLNIPLDNASSNNFCRYLFYECTSLETADVTFSEDNNLTSVGYYFCDEMFRGCTSLTSLSDSFNIPQNITIATLDFCDCMFNNCTALTTLPDNFNIPQGITDVGNAFCKYMFYNCSSLISLPDNFNIPQGITTNSPSSFCQEIFYGCSKLSEGTTVALTFPFDALNAFNETNIGITSPSAGVTVNLKGNSDFYFIKYYDQNGNFLKTQHIEIKEGETTIGSFAINSEDLNIPDNSFFFGWQDEDGNIITENTPITESISLYPIIIPTTFTTEGLTYTITDQTAKAVAISGYEEGASSFTISTSAEYDGITFTIEKILHDAFSSASNLEVTVDFSDPSLISLEEYEDEKIGTLTVPANSEAYFHSSDWFNYFTIYGYNAVNDEFTIDGITYQKTADNEAQIVGVTEDEIEIVTSISFNTENFTVTNIANDAFADYTDLSVTIVFTDPSTISLEEYIGEKVGTLTVPSGSGFDYYNSDWANYFDIETISFSDGNLYYRVDTEVENDQVSIMYDESYLAINQTVTFPESVEYNNTAFVVLSIENDAFLDCENIQAQVNFIDPKTIELGKVADKKVGTLAVPDGAVGLYEHSDWAYYFEVDTTNRYLLIDSVYYVFKADSAQTSSLKATRSSISVEVDHVDPDATSATIPGEISIDLGDGITVSYSVTSMNSDALKDCENLTSVTIDSSTPIECADALSRVPSGCTVIVPDDQYEEYLQMFSNAGLTNVTVKATSDAISTIKVNEKIEISRYNLLGQKISSPQKGINIIKYSDGSVEKVLVK